VAAVSRPDAMPAAGKLMRAYHLIQIILAGNVDELTARCRGSISGEYGIACYLQLDLIIGQKMTGSYKSLSPSATADHLMS